MNEIAKACERGGELVSVLYGEATEAEQREFALHAKNCATCREEFAAFAQVRGRVGAWRDEALGGFVSSPVVATPRRKSALAALRQFFALSPWWMKGAVAFAGVVFCVLAVLAFGRFSGREVPRVAANNLQAVYTKEDVQRAVDDALAKQEALVRKEHDEPVVAAPQPRLSPVSSGVKRSTVAKSQPAPEGRRPFSRAERDQLAAELRLISGDESDFEFPDE